MSEAAAAPPLDRLPDRFLAALLSAAEHRQVSAFVGMREGLLGVVVLPDSGSGVAIVDRGSDTPEALHDRIETLLKGHGNGILHLVLAGGTAADRPVLEAADRAALDPNRLGMHLVDTTGKLERVAGRRLGLLADAARRIPAAEPLEPTEIAAHNGRAQKRREEAAAFAAALDHRPQRATLLLGVVNIILFALTVHWGARDFDRALIDMGANREILVFGSEPWRVLSYAFLHGNIGHLIGNLIGLFVFAGFLEGILGWRRIVVIYATAALVGGLTAVIFGHVHESVGASGAIWGFITAGLGIVLRREAILPPLVSGRMRARLVGVLGLMIASSFLPFWFEGMRRIDLWAHVGGGIAGFALAGSGLITRGLIPGAAPVGPEANPRWLRVAAAVAILAMAASIGLAIATGHPWNQPVILRPDEMV